MTNVTELTQTPAVGATVEFDRPRKVNSVEEDAARGEVRVYLSEDAEDLAVQILPQAHMAYIELMKAKGWEVEGEDELMAWLKHRIRRQRHAGPVAQN
ncbi:hypothetical protein WME91_17330 [Sorangium sp. So ce269]